MGCRTGVLLVVGLLAQTAGIGVASAQELALAKPRFIASWVAPGDAADASNAAVLQRRVSLDLSDVPLSVALRDVASQARLDLSYNKSVLPEGRLVSLHARDITVVAALTEVLLNSGLDVAVGRTGQLALVRKPAAAVLDTGAVAGRVKDAKTGAALAGATVAVEGTSRSATTGNDGRYRIAGLAPGTYTVRARYIGYAPAAASVTVTADQEAAADFELEKSTQQLDEVVTTGTVVPTEVRALPMPVSVISDSDVARQRPHTVQELFRQAIPTAVSWDFAAFPIQTAFSVRGASTLSDGTGQMKVLVDGIELTNPTTAGLDPNSIERIEVIRGPQAAAIYGSGAIGGVIQIFTRRGGASLTRPSVDAEAALGAVQTPYAGYGGVLRQTYKGGVQGGATNVSYNFGAGYSHTDDWAMPGSAQSNPSIYAGMRYSRGAISADISGRYYTQDNPVTFNPDLFQSGFAFLSKPLYQAVQYQNQTLAGRISVAPTRWWQSTILVGVDRQGNDAMQTQPRLLFAADTFLSVSNSNQTKASIAYNTTFQAPLARDVSASLTGGFDHYTLQASGWDAEGALTTTGTIAIDPSQPITANRNITNNTGYFAQAQVGFRDALFVTGGVRAEQNTNFGDSLGTPVSPRAGITYVQEMRGATVKLRASYGRAIRAPGTGQKIAATGPASVQLANPGLGPERERGWDAGIDAAFGGRASLSVTYYDQTAENLIDFVQVDPSATPPASQYQNVGQVHNTGVEIEAMLRLGVAQLKAQYGYARARVERLSPTYTGDLQIGDQVLDTPKHTAGASLSLTPLPGMTVAAGLTYVGSWNAYDNVALFRCFGGTGPCQASSREYIIAYPSFAKLNATISQQIARDVSGFVSVDNLTNNESAESGNFNAVIGRITTVGVRFAY